MILSSREPDDTEALKVMVEELDEELEIMTSYSLFLNAIINTCARAELMADNGAPVSELKAMHVELGTCLQACWKSAFDTTYCILLVEANINRIEEMIP